MRGGAALVRRRRISVSRSRIKVGLEGVLGGEVQVENGRFC